MSKFSKKESKKKQNFKNQDSKFLKYAFISGILIVVLFVLSIILNLIFIGNARALQTITLIQNVLTIVFVFYFFYGFFVIGRRYGKFLKIISALIILIFLGYCLLNLFSPYFFGKDLMLKLDEKANSVGFDSAVEFFNYINTNINTNQVEVQEYTDFMVREMIPLILPILIVFLSYLLMAFILFILFGVGLIKIGNDVKYARVAGILAVIGICTMIILIGIFVWLVAYVFMLIILLKESRKK